MFNFFLKKIVPKFLTTSRDGLKFLRYSCLDLSHITAPQADPKESKG